MPAPPRDESLFAIARPRHAARSTRVLGALLLACASAGGLGASIIRDASHHEHAETAALIGSQRIDPNTASAAQLTLLPRIGPVLAERIVAERDANGPFRDAPDMARVSGIGPKTVERIGGMLRFDADQPASARGSAPPARND
jgi:competence ComEA-like helix-hairpin-helix protein